MGDWFRSATVLVMAFVAAVAVTIGLATVIVPGGAPDPEAADAAGGSRATPDATSAPPEGVGGNLSVTGDHEGTLTLTREANEDRYSLLGDGTRMVFEGDPPAVAQVSWEGLEFFPDPENCTITPGELDDQLGVGYAEVDCTDLVDIREGGTINLSGTIGLPLTMVGESQLPEMGGSVTVGGETWEFAEALLFTFPVNSGPGEEDYNMELVDEGSGSLRFRYDVQTHALTLISTQRDGETATLGPGACSLGTNELGRIAPSAAIVELSIECPAAEVPGLGPVPIVGTVIVQQVEF
jgi:hypothetical protein